MVSLYEIFKEIMPFGVFLTFLMSLYSISNTRKNLLTSKYIEAITTERIKWIGILRNEAANIITNIKYSINVYSCNIASIENEELRYENESFPKTNKQIGDIAEQYKNRNNTFTSLALADRKDFWSQSDFIKYLNLFKLCLNPNDDKNIIEIINYFIDFYSKEDKSKNDIQIANKNLDLFIKQIQIILKYEWEKVKREFKGKSK